MLSSSGMIRNVEMLICKYILFQEQVYIVIIKFIYNWTEIIAKCAAIGISPQALFTWQYPLLVVSSKIYQMKISGLPTIGEVFSMK